MSTFQKIIDSQDALLKSLACCESTVAELYAAYKTRFPKMADFWGKLAAEERRHAEMIEAVRSDLLDGTIMHGLGHFKAEEVQKLIDFVREKIDELQRDKTTANQAVAIALSIESSIIDSRFFDFAKSNGSAFQKVALQLAHETQEHIKLVQEARLALQKAM